MLYFKLYVIKRTISVPNKDYYVKMYKKDLLEMKPIYQHQRHNLILERLRNGETLSITALAKEWKTTPKTLQRDFKKLMEGNYGIVRAQDGKRFTIKKEKIGSKDVLSTIQLLESMASEIGGEFYTKTQTALRKLQHYINSPFYTRIDVEQISDKLDLIADLEEAINEQKKVTFTYKRWYRPKQIKTYRHVEPYKIIIFDGFFYLLTRYKDHTIKFYLREIDDLHIEEETFEKDEVLLEKMEKAQGIWFNPHAEPFEVTLLLESDAIVYFERKPVKGQYLKKNKDHTAELTLTITDKREVFDIMKKWLPQIRIIEPYALQEEFEEMLKGYLN